MTVISGQLEGFINTSMINSTFRDYAKYNNSVPLDCAWDVRVKPGYSVSASSLPYLFAPEKVLNLIGTVTP